MLHSNCSTALQEYCSIIHTHHTATSESLGFPTASLAQSMTNLYTVCQSDGEKYFIFHLLFSSKYICSIFTHFPHWVSATDFV